MDLVDVATRFAQAMRHCDNLVAVHRGHGGPAQGRRDQEVSINRGVVVMTVAAWQAVVQDLALAAVDAGTPQAGSPIMTQTYAVIAGRVRKEVEDFATPNAQNVRRLLQGVGFDPRPLWTWSQRGGQGVGMVLLQPHDVEDRMRDWLRLRHDIAHGHDEVSHVPVLQAVRRTPQPPPDWSPTIRLVDAEACMSFFRRTSRLTAVGLAGTLNIPAGQWT